MVATTVSAIPDGATVVVDSAPVIYFLENHARLAQRFAPVFERAEAGTLRVVASAITLAEVVSGPLASGNELLAERYRTAIESGTGWSVMPVTAALAMTAARLRTRYRLRLPDAIQLATAVACGAWALVTHDRDFRKVRDVRVVS
jgi:predicted nucleic acid-binding protein